MLKVVSFHSAKVAALLCIAVAVLGVVFSQPENPTQLRGQAGSQKEVSTMFSHFPSL
jgi:hypothetical protein